VARQTNEESAFSATDEEKDRWKGTTNAVNPIQLAH